MRVGALPRLVQNDGAGTSDVRFAEVFGSATTAMSCRFQFCTRTLLHMLTAGYGASRKAACGVWTAAYGSKPDSARVTSASMRPSAWPKPLPKLA
jgi:hypothetical protein